MAAAAGADATSADEGAPEELYQMKEQDCAQEPLQREKNLSSASSRISGRSGGNKSNNNSDSSSKRSKSPVIDLWQSLMEEFKEGKTCSERALIGLCHSLMEEFKESENCSKKALKRILREEKKKKLEEQETERLGAVFSWQSSVGFGREVQNILDAPNSSKNNITDGCSCKFQTTGLGYIGSRVCAAQVVRHYLLVTSFIRMPIYLRG